MDNLTTSRSIHHSVGVWTGGKFSWLDDDSWKMKVDFEEDALISSITATNEELGVELQFQDFVDSKYAAWCRHIKVRNIAGKSQEVRLFLHQAFQISRGGRGDTALFVPNENYILDFKGWCSLLTYAQDESGRPFDQYAVGNYGIEGKEGTFRDAEDGALSNNPVEHGGVDSVVRCTLRLDPDASTFVDYWIIASDSQFDAEIIHHFLLQKGLQKRLETTREYWHNWLATASPKLAKVDPRYLTLAKKSLLVVKAHIDRHGGIIASCDSSIYNYGRDYYSYVWPRDGALTMLTLIDLGYQDEAKRFFKFCADTMHPGGYMMHKYQPDRAIGSTWHPLVHDRRSELAIQEDETAVVVYAMAQYHKAFNDSEFIKDMYEHFIRPCANFMTRFIDPQTNLPHASYDLWEERFATHTYTVALTAAALRSASDLAASFGSPEEVSKWREASERINAAMKILYNQERGYYRRSVLLAEDGKLEYDDTLDSASAYGVIRFDATRASSEALKNTYEAIARQLADSCPIGGVPRYEHDNYFLKHDEYLGNPWIITTLWLSRYYLANNQFDKAKHLIDWVNERASPSGMLPEQVEPVDGSAVGVSPLAWSHSCFVHTVLMLADATRQAGH